jgi:hypothetical protein
MFPKVKSRVLGVTFLPILCIAVIDHFIGDFLARPPWDRGR